MNEFIEKLICRLEEKVVNRTFDESIKTKNLAYKEAIKIVNQLAEEYMTCYKSCTECEAYDKEKNYCPKWCDVIKNTAKELAEEYNNDFCEWKKVFDDDVDSQYKPLCSEDGFIDITGYFDYEFCPYCGKKIKIAPYQPEGE